MIVKNRNENERFEIIFKEWNEILNTDIYTCLR